MTHYVYDQQEANLTSYDSIKKDSHAIAHFLSFRGARKKRPLVMQIIFEQALKNKSGPVFLFVL